MDNQMSRGTGDLSREALRSFPKVELHRHLEGTFSLPTLHQMALRNGLPFPEELGEFRKRVQFPKDSDPDFLKFLSLFKYVCSPITYAEYRQLT